MKLLRIIDKETGLFKRDDFTFGEKEIGLDVEPAQGFVLPKWQDGQWVEGGVKPAPQPVDPTLEDRVAKVETSQDEIVNVLAEIVGVSV